LTVARGRILVVDDDAGFRVFAQALLERAGFAVELAADADAALDAVRLAEPHVVLLDVCLPGMSGYEVCHRLRDSLGDALPIIFISGERITGYDRVAGLLLGADDYLAKPFDPDELLARLRRLLVRCSDGAEPESEELIDALTPREREILALLAAGRTSKHIAYELVISPRTLGTHTQHILQKLGVHNRTQAVAIATRSNSSRPTRTHTPPN
jgi:DNA-binding NarL/FixJ family response regulator